MIADAQIMATANSHYSIIISLFNSLIFGFTTLLLFTYFDLRNLWNLSDSYLVPNAVAVGPFPLLLARHHDEHGILGGVRPGSTSSLCLVLLSTEGSLVRGRRESVTEKTHLDHSVSFHPLSGSGHLILEVV